PRRRLARNYFVDARVRSTARILLPTVSVDSAHSRRRRRAAATRAHLLGRMNFRFVARARPEPRAIGSVPDRRGDRMALSAERAAPSLNWPSARHSQSGFA